MRYVPSVWSGGCVRKCLVSGQVGLFCREYVAYVSGVWSGGCLRKCPELTVKAGKKEVFFSSLDYSIIYN